MIFNLLDTLAQMENAFGSEGELLLLQDKQTIHIRLRVIKNSQLYNSAFEINKNQIDDNFVYLMNLKFHQAIQELKHIITEESL